MLIKDALIMEIMETQNGLNITKEMVENSIGSFANTPIVWNRDEQFKDYTENSFKNYFTENIVIGIVTEDVKIVENNVLSDIIIYDEYMELWKGKYDNWCIQFDDDNRDKFTVSSIEVF